MLVLSACSEADPTSPGGGDSAKQKEAAEVGARRCAAELEGLDLDARREKLIELAKAEIDDDKPLTMYSGSSLIPDMLDAFSESTGIDVELLTSGGNTSSASRIQTEVDAGVVGADITELGDQFIEGENGFAATGYTLPMDSPYEDDVEDTSKGEQWTGIYLNPALPVWNTDSITTAPTSWRDMFETYGLNKDCKFGFEIEDVQWFANVVEDPRGRGDDRGRGDPAVHGRRQGQPVHPR